MATTNRNRFQQGGEVMKLRKAEEHEKRNYQLTSPVRPLWGYAVNVPAVIAGVKTRVTVPVEGLFEYQGPQYEAILPDGLHLAGEYIHTVLGFSRRDLLDRLSQGLKECNEACKD